MAIFSGPLAEDVGQPTASGASVPIWLAALNAAQCQAESNRENHEIGWDFESGRALYTNSGSAMECIAPFGVFLDRGQTLAVSWRPGETEYTTEVFDEENRSAA